MECCERYEQTTETELNTWNTGTHRCWTANEGPSQQPTVKPTTGDKRQTPFNKAPLATSETKNFLCLYVPNFNLVQGYRKK